MNIGEMKKEREERSKEKVLKRTIVVVCIWLLAFVFREGLFSLIEKSFPFTSRVPNNNWYIQLALFGVVTLLYACNWKYLLYRRELFPNRFKIILAGIAFFLLFRYSNRIEYYHAPNVCLSYLGMCFIWAILIELAIIIYHLLQKDATQEPHNSTNVFVYDAPAKQDGLKRGMHAGTLINKIVSTLRQNNIETSFCILLNEQYGAGKSSFFNLLKKNARNVNLRYIEFRPWLSDSPSSMMQDFLMLLEEELRISSPSLAKDVQAYSRMISGIHVGFIELAFNSDLRPQSLTKRRDLLVQKMKESPQPLLILVDDVDRLDSQELLSLLKLIRNTADFPYLCYILAADKDSISQNLKNKGIVDTDLYLRKFFNLELAFPPVDNELLELLSKNLTNELKKYSIPEHRIRECTQFVGNIESIQDVFTTPRDIYRFINLVSYSLDLLRKGDLLQEVNVLDVILITLVQFISPEWYKVLRDRNDKLLDYVLSSGRYVLNKKKVAYFYTRRVLETLKAVEEQHTLTMEKVNPNVETQLSEIISSTQRDPMNALKGIISGMFGSSTDTKTPERICYKNEFFKYFAGHYRNNELTTAEAFAYFNSSFSDFAKTINGLNREKTISLIHKMRLYVEENNGYNKVDILQKIMKLAQKSYSFSGVSESAQYPNSVEERIVRSMFFSAEKRKDRLDSRLGKEKNELFEFFNRDTRYSLISVVLKSFRVSDDFHFIYGDDVPVKLQEALIDRFIFKELRQNPIKDNVINVIPELRRMNEVYWDESFKRFIIGLKNPMPWFYRFVIKRRNKIVWNNTYIETVFAGSFDYQELFRDLNDSQISQEVKRDFMKLLANTNAITISEESHPFITEAMAWHRKNSPTN